MVNLRDRDNLRRKDKEPVSKMSFVRSIVLVLWHSYIVVMRITPLCIACDWYIDE